MSATHFRSYEFSELLTIHYRLTGALLYAKLFFFSIYSSLNAIKIKI